MTGSRARRDAVLNGVDAVEVADAGRADAYRTARGGGRRTIARLMQWNAHAPHTKPSNNHTSTISPAATEPWS